VAAWKGDTLKEASPKPVTFNHWGRGFESLRAHQIQSKIKDLKDTPGQFGNVLFFVSALCPAKSGFQKEKPAGVARREVSTDSDLNRDSAAGLQKGHERGRTVSDVARNICAGADGVCLHHDLFNHPLFDGGLKPAWPAKSRHPVRQAVAALYALTQ